MKTVNIHQAKTHLSRLIERAVAGEEVVIAKAGKPMVKLVPVTTLEEPRPLGLLTGRVRERADCWGADTELEDLFYGEGDKDEARRSGADEGTEG